MKCGMSMVKAESLRAFLGLEGTQLIGLVYCKESDSVVVAFEYYELSDLGMGETENSRETYLKE